MPDHRCCQTRECWTREVQPVLASVLNRIFPCCGPAPVATSLQRWKKDSWECWQNPSRQASLGSVSLISESKVSLLTTMAEGDVLLSKDPESAETWTAEDPTVQDLEQLLSTGPYSCNRTDEVWPNLFLGDLVTAHNRFGLWKMGITHVLNAAHGTMFCQGGQDFYGTTIDYYGVPAYDLPDFDISQYFFSAAEFINKALNTPGAKILVHCAVGISRSASLVLAYLMIKHHFPLVKAIKAVKEHRWISPNRGFLKQLQNLDIQLRQTREC